MFARPITLVWVTSGIANDVLIGSVDVMRHAIAQPPKVPFVTRLQSHQLPSETARQLPDLSTTIRVEPSSTELIRFQSEAVVVAATHIQATNQRLRVKSVASSMMPRKPASVGGPPCFCHARQTLWPRCEGAGAKQDAANPRRTQRATENRC